MVNAARETRFKHRIGIGYNASTEETPIDYELTRVPVQVDESPSKRVDADGVAHYPFNTGKETAI